jgi:hypothetical protein
LHADLHAATSNLENGDLDPFADPDLLSQLSAQN